MSFGLTWPIWVTLKNDKKNKLIWVYPAIVSAEKMASRCLWLPHDRQPPRKQTERHRFIIGNVTNDKARRKYATGFPGCPAALRSARLSKFIIFTRPPVAKATSLPHLETVTRAPWELFTVTRHFPCSRPQTCARSVEWQREEEAW